MGMRFRTAAAVLLWAAVWPAAAETFICQTDGKAAFSSYRINASCVRSQMDGISDTEPAAASASAASDAASGDVVQRIWQQAEYGSYDDVKILPPAPPPPPALIKLRQQPPAVAPVRYAPPVFTPPKLSHGELLGREIAREQAALAKTRQQLEAAKKSGGDTAALLRAVRDREASIRAMQNEIR